MLTATYSALITLAALANWGLQKSTQGEVEVFAGNEEDALDQTSFQANDGNCHWFMFMVRHKFRAHFHSFHLHVSIQL